jgi:hypothetical protein
MNQIALILFILTEGLVVYSNLLLLSILCLKISLKLSIQYV